jgi:uncharacterized repeat protein (TIGR01451 family)
MKKFKMFFASRKNVAKGFLKVALFGVIISSTVFPTAAFNPSVNNRAGVSVPFGVAAAKADTCADALAVGEAVNNTTPSVGDAITYELVGAPAFTSPTQVSVSNVLPAGVTYVSSTADNGTYDSGSNTWNVGTLNGASVIKLFVTATVNPGTEGQTIPVTPTIVYGTNSCDDSSAAAGATITVKAATVTTPPVADIAITKTVDNATPHVGDTVHYSLNVVDNGPASTTGVVATDVLPSGLTFVSATPSAGTSYASSTGTWTIGALSASSTVTLAIAATVNAGTASTTITNTGTVTESASTTDPNLANNSSSVSIFVQNTPVTTTSTPAVADIAITKTADVTSTQEGGTVHYTLTATDLGPATSTDVVATDTLPSGLTFVSANATQGAYASSTGTWTIGTLASSSSATLTIAATANTGTAGSTITNTATITENASTTDPNLANNTASVNVSVLPNSIGTCSIATALGEAVSNPTPSVGDTITYTLLGAPAFTAPTHLIVTELLPSSYLTFVSASTSDGTYTSSTGTWDLGTLNGANVIKLQIMAKVNPAAAGQTITTTPSIQYIQSGCTQTSAVAGATITVPSIPVVATTTADIAITKSVDVATTHEGATVHYTLTATDNGPATSTDVVATDTLPSGLTFVNATATAGTSYSSSTGTWTIGTLASGSSATLTIAANVNTGTASSTITNTATITENASTTDPNLANNTATASTYVEPNPSGTCSVATAIAETVSNPTPNVGDTITYTLAGAPAFTAPTHMIVTDLLPFLDLTFVSASTSDGTYASSTGIWDLGTLNGSSTISLGITATVDPSAAGKTITMNPSVEYIQSNCTQTSAVTGTTIVVQSPVTATTTADVAIVKTADVTSTFEGSIVHYTLAVSANGPATSTGVVANDVLPSTLTFVSAAASEGSYASSTGVWTLGDMDASSSATLTIAAKVNSGTASSTITNTGTVSESASSTDPDLANNSSSVSIYVNPNPLPTTADIAIQKTADVASTTPGATVHYTLMVSANGPATSTGVVASDVLPSELTFVNATASIGSYASSTGLWTIGDMSVGATSTLTIAATVNSGTASSTITNTGTVSESASSTDPNLANNSSSVSVYVEPYAVCTTGCGGGSMADIAIQKTADVTSTIAGATVHYTLTVTDNGPDASTGVVATDTLPSGLTFVSATPSAGTSYASSTGTWTIGTLSANATAILAIAASVDASAASSTVTNTAYVTESPSITDTNLANNSSSVSIVVAPNSGTPVADISIVKTVDTTSTVVGATVNYLLTATDLGPATSTGVVATDTLPSGVTFVSATSSPGTAYNFGTGTWTIGTLAPNATATLAIAATVGASAAGTTITNTAYITESASTTDPDLANNSSSVSTVVAGGGGGGQVADISIVKTVDNQYPNPGDTVNYTLSVANAGPSTSTIDVANDILPMGLNFVSATSSPGTAYNFGTGVWTIGTLAPNATATLAIAAQVGTNEGGQTITNTATVSQLSSITDPNPGNNSSSVSIYVATTTPFADIAIVKTVDKSTANVGDTLNYTLNVTDNGPATSTGVVAADVLPSGLTFVNATASVGTYATSTGTWTIGDMSASSTATLTIAATVNADQAGATITNTGTVGESASSTDQNLANNSSTVTTTINGGGGCTSNCGGGCTSNCGGGGSQTAEIAIAKTVDNANPSTGATIHYTVTVSALGPATSIGVTATDTLPSGIAFVSASTSIGTYNPSTGSWTIGQLNDGQNAVLVITATVIAPAGTSITNTGTVRESPVVVDQISGNNTASATLVVAGGGGGGGGGQVLGTSTSTGQVLGASACGLYLDQYIHPIRKNLNNPDDVKKLQTFLNQTVGANLPITGYYGPLTIAAVDQFQVKYHTEMLFPWVPLGLPNEFTSTGYVYQTTWRWINLIMCPSLNLPMPILQVDQGFTTYNYN